MKNPSLSIHSIYLATEGEGVHLGRPQIFVRFQGCSIGCINCDSKETWEFDTLKLSLDKCLERIHALMGPKRVSLTGGDPTHPKLEGEVLRLAKELKRQGVYLNLEASGMRISEELFETVDFISFDIKTPSTRVQHPIPTVVKFVNHTKYQGKFQIKSVIQDQKDFDYIVNLRKELALENVNLNFPWVLTPSFRPEEEFPKNRIIHLQKWNESLVTPFIVIPQIHKILHGTQQLTI